MRPDPPTFGQEAVAAEWIGPRLTGAWGTVTGSGTVPDGYEAYARLLHPVEVGDGLRSWADVAADTGRRIHPLVQWHRLVGIDDDEAIHGNAQWDGGSPSEGNLHPVHLAALLDVLARHTANADDCWFAVWDGWGTAVDDPDAVVWLRGAGPFELVTNEVWWRRTPSRDRGFHLQPPGGPMHLPGRDYHLGRGPLRSAPAIGVQHDGWFDPQSPNLWWPDDRDWFAATEIDFDSTLVAGTRPLVDDLLAHRVLEAVEVRPGDRLTVDADTVN